MKRNLGLGSFLWRLQALRFSPHTVRRSYFTPLRKQCFSACPTPKSRITSASFTTSPTAIPPHNEDSTTSSHPTSLTSSSAAPPSAPPSASSAVSSEALPEPIKRPSYQLTFTCKPCKERSTHEISKQGYHYGTVLITCPGCKNRHAISDHLKIFADRSFTLEDLMRDKGELVKRGSINSDGDIEFWDKEGKVPDN